MKAIAIRFFAIFLAFPVTFVGIFLACHREVTAPPDVEKQRVAAAEQLTEVFARSRFAEMDIRAHAITKDCSVLYLHVTEPMPEHVAEGLWYGAGAYEVVPRGLFWYCQQNGFRGAIFEDDNNTRWAFGDAKAIERERAVLCQ